MIPLINRCNSTPAILLFSPSAPPSLGKAPAASITGQESKPPSNPAAAPHPRDRSTCSPGPSASRFNGSDCTKSFSQVLSTTAYTTPRINPYITWPTSGPKSVVPCSADQSTGNRESTGKIVIGPKNHQKIPN